jgi:hypothetical protein
MLVAGRYSDERRKHDELLIQPAILVSANRIGPSDIIVQEIKLDVGFSTAHPSHTS